jgi:hypothetical protein
LRQLPPEYILFCCSINRQPKTGFKMAVYAHCYNENVILMITKIDNNS